MTLKWLMWVQYLLLLDLAGSFLILLLTLTVLSFRGRLKLFDEELPPKDLMVVTHLEIYV